MVRGVFVAALAVLPVQTLVHHGAPEPYPGIYQPSFGGAVMEGVDYQTYEPVVSVVDASGSKSTVDYRDVLPPTPVVPFSVFRSAFEDDARAHDPRSERWLRQRLMTLAPGGDPQTVVVDWVHVDRRIGSDESKVADVAKTVTVDVSSSR